MLQDVIFTSDTGQRTDNLANAMQSIAVACEALSLSRRVRFHAVAIVSMKYVAEDLMIQSSMCVGGLRPSGGTSLTVRLDE